MKKIICLVLAVMVFCSCTAAFSDNNTGSQECFQYTLPPKFEADDLTASEFFALSDTGAVKGQGIDIDALGIADLPERIGEEDFLQLYLKGTLDEYETKIVLSGETEGITYLIAEIYEDDHCLAVDLLIYSSVKMMTFLIAEPDYEDALYIVNSLKLIETGKKIILRRPQDNHLPKKRGIM